MEHNKNDLALLYGEFKPYKSFEEIIEKEYNSWINTAADGKVIIIIIFLNFYKPKRPN